MDENGPDVHFSMNAEGGGVRKHQRPGPSQSFPEEQIINGEYRHNSSVMQRRQVGGRSVKDVDLPPTAENAFNTASGTDPWLY
ncbi:hypothetical protein [Steroidobacter cummioxidans]|uniref:hypothetical protein n=1 Tax=Steroidobacter cummioxidans TaxID=1803913 RepID=UPI00129060CE|nr:hypothetical protein [Steroidobacter cummioxidans]